MVLILGGNSDHAVHEWRKKVILEEEKLNLRLLAFLTKCLQQIKFHSTRIFSNKTKFNRAMIFGCSPTLGSKMSMFSKFSLFFYFPSVFSSTPLTPPKLNTPLYIWSNRYHSYIYTWWMAYSNILVSPVGGEHSYGSGSWFWIIFDTDPVFPVLGLLIRTRTCGPLSQY